jgi:hypothetical protein
MVCHGRQHNAAEPMWIDVLVGTKRRICRRDLTYPLSPSLACLLGHIAPLGSFSIQSLGPSSSSQLSSDHCPLAGSMDARRVSPSLPPLPLPSFWTIGGRNAAQAFDRCQQVFINWFSCMCDIFSSSRADSCKSYHCAQNS